MATIYLVGTVDGIRPGLEGRLERVVEGELITRHVGGGGTFATPAMIGLMEITSPPLGRGPSARRHTPRSDTRCTSGTSPRQRPGAPCVITTRVNEVKGNKLYFDVECRQDDKLVGTGIHKRAIVPADF